MDETSIWTQLLLRPWWTYEPNQDLFSEVYRWLNLIEGSAWMILSALVLLRFIRYRRSVLEIVYAWLFLTFGITDFLESRSIDIALIAVKLINLIALLWVRWYVIKHFYPDRRTF